MASTSPSRVSVEEAAGINAAAEGAVDWFRTRGAEPGRVMAELYGKATGLSKGKGGSMHMADVRRHLWGGYAIVGGHIPVATGPAPGQQNRKLPQVVALFFGEGAG